MGKLIVIAFFFLSSCDSLKSNLSKAENNPYAVPFNGNEEVNNLFVYGTLALPEKQKELGLVCKSEIPYDYIKGYALKEIYEEGYGTFLCAYPDAVGIISGRVLLDCNLKQSQKKLDEWEDSYSKYLTKTKVNNIDVIFFAE